jgi:TRAP transporter TAXI family solute receptor
MRREVIVTVLVFVLVMCMSIGTAFAGKKFITMATASPGGVYYPLGGGMAVVIEKTAPDLRCATESTGGSVENSRLVGSGDTDIGMAMGSIAYKATQGLEPFKKPYPLLALFQMYSAPEHIVVAKSSNVKSVKDMKGKKVSIDVPGSGCSVMAKAILEAYGYNLDEDLRIANLSQPEAVQALKDGIIDVAFFNFAYPASAVMDLCATRDIDLVPLEPEMIDNLTKKYGYYVKSVIPANTYVDVDRDIECLGDSNLMVAHKDMPDEIAYQIVKAIYESVHTGKWALINVHPIAAQLTPQNALNSPIPLHPGALKYFKEKGALK